MSSSRLTIFFIKVNEEKFSFQGRILNGHSNKIKRIKRELKEFQVKMLDLCDGSEQVNEK